MFIYLLLIIFLAFIYLLSRKFKTPDKSFLTLFVATCTLFLGSRHNLYSFPDDGMYYNLYKAFIYLSFDEVKIIVSDLRDYVFYYFVWGLAQIVKSPQFYLMLETCLVLCSISIFLYKESSDPIFSMIMLWGFGMISFSMSASRQGIAMSLCLIAYTFLENSDHEKKTMSRKAFGIFLVFLATLLHKTAYNFALVVLLTIFQKLYVKTLITVTFIILIYFFPDYIFQTAADFLGKNYIAEYNMAMTGFWIELSILATPIIIIGIAANFSKDNVHTDNLRAINQSSLILFSIICCVFWIARLYAQGFERICYYYMPFTAAAYPAAIDRWISENDEKRIIKIVLGFLSITLFLFKLKHDFVFCWE